MSVSEWSRSSTGHLELSASLPGVHASHRRVWLGEGGRTLRIRAARPIPLQDPACLPRGARLSKDGTSEIFDATFPVVPAAAAARPAVQQEGSTLRILVPTHTEIPVDDANDAKTEDAQLASLSPQAPTGDIARPRAQDLVPKSRYHIKQPKQLRSQRIPTPEELEDVEVLDEDFLWPEKQADAASGWWDNRGEFHEY